jgi:CheY-like chemotaxis protein
VRRGLVCLDRSRPGGVFGVCCTVVTADSSSFFDVALVKDDAGAHLAAAEAAITRLRDGLGAELVELDILFLDPSLLVAILHLDPAKAGEELVRTLAVAARGEGFRVLRPMLLSAAERQQFYDERLSRFSFRVLRVEAIPPVFAALRTRLSEALSRPTVRPTNEVELRFLLRYANEAALLTALGAIRSGDARGFFVACSALPNIGAHICLAVEVKSGQGPIHLDAQVVAVHDAGTGDQSERPMGFDVALVLSPEQTKHLESFLSAVHVGKPWPEKYSRQYERFPIRLPVEYFFEGELRHEYTGNLSLGGVFIESSNPPGRGTTLTVRLYATANNASVDLAGRVMHSTGTVEAAALGRKSGVGVQFAEPSLAVRQKLEAIIGSIESPTYRRVMLVEDDRFFQVLLGNMLRQAGFEVMLAVDGSDAFHRLLDELLRLDLLVLDLCLPGMSGEELVEMVRSVGGEENLAVVVITGADLTDQDRQRIAALGADDVIEKRVAPELMLARIEATLKRRAADKCPQ